MLRGTKHMLAATAVALCLFSAAPAFSDTVTTRETVTESGDGTVMKKTVTETAPAPATVRTTVTETPAGDTVVRKTVTQTAPATTTVRTTVTTAAPARTETVWHMDSATGARVVAFADLDLNRDNILSVYEIGTILFRIYDTDGNDIIDNIEYQNRVMVTVTPIEKNTVITYDFDGDGVADKTQYTYETFMRDTLLTRFDANRNGLSPQEFTGRSFLEADINDDKAIDLKEWKGSYIASIDRKNKENARFN